MTQPTNSETVPDQPLKHPGQSIPSGHKSAGRYPIYRESGSVSAPLLDQLQKLGFTDRQMRTLARLSPETQEEVYTAVVTMLMSDDPVLEDILGWI